MRKLAWGAVALALAALTMVAVAATAEEASDGKQEYVDQKCNMCHGVSTVGIEAKTTSDKMKGPDLVDLAEEWSGKSLVEYMKREADKDGKQHKKEFKGSDEELQAIVDWLLEQKAEAE